MAGQLGLATEDNPPRLCSLAALAGSCPNQFPFKLSQSAQYGQHQSTVRCCRVGPRIPQGFEPGAFFGNRPQQIEQIARRPRQSIESGDNEYVAFRQDRHQTRELLAIRPSSANFFLKNLLAFGCF
jgi:hypothetical protein